MEFQIHKAERKKAKLKIGVAGPSGSGKTMSALLLAKGLVQGDLSKVCIIDTEHNSADLYSHLGPYHVISFKPPYSPERYTSALSAALAAKFEVIIIDSCSHEWAGKGGCLEIQTKLGGKYQDWGRVTPMHQGFVNGWLEAPAWVILTIQKKQDHAMTQENGKAKVQKMGMNFIQRDGFEYDLTMCFDVEINHFASASKDRTGVFMPRGSFTITEQTGEEILNWSNSGADALPELDLGDYTINFGTKYKGQKLKDLDMKVIESIIVYIEATAVKAHTELTPTEIDFITTAKKYLEEIDDIKF